jgi:hypothetical protein
MVDLGELLRSFFTNLITKNQGLLINDCQEKDFLPTLINNRLQIN